MHLKGQAEGEAITQVFHTRATGEAWAKQEAPRRQLFSHSKSSRPLLTGLRYFMIKAIAEDRGVAMPSFFAYFLYAAALMPPLLAIVTAPML